MKFKVIFRRKFFAFNIFNFLTFINPYNIQHANCTLTYNYLSLPFHYYYIKYVTNRKCNLKIQIYRGTFKGHLKGIDIFISSKHASLETFQKNYTHLCSAAFAVSSGRVFISMAVFKVLNMWLCFLAW